MSIGKAKAALESCNGMPVSGAGDMALLAIANALVAIAEQGVESTLECTENKSRWAQMFGTPEKAARTMALQCFGATSEACDACVFGECDGKLRNSGTYLTVKDALLEWLGGDAK